MTSKSADAEVSLPPPERGRSIGGLPGRRSYYKNADALHRLCEARRVGVSGFNRTALKTKRARSLRAASTNVEMRVWQRLRNKQLGADFRRQHPAGPYILDFYCPALRLAVELDGGQHASRMQQDERRTNWLAERGVTVLRFWNSDVTENLVGVLEVIAAQVSALQLAPQTPTRRWRAYLPLSGGGSRPHSAKGSA